MVDDATGSPTGIPLSAEMTDRAEGRRPAAGRAAARRSGNWHAGTNVANVAQQDYFAAVTTRAVLPHVQGAQ